MPVPVLCHATGIGNPGAGVSCYVPLAAGARMRHANTVEAVPQFKYHTPGVFTNLIAVVQTNTTTGSSTVDFRKGGVSGNSTVTIGAGATGTFEDTAHNDVILVGDLVNLRVANGTGGALTIYQAGMLFTASGAQTAWKLGSIYASGETGTSQTVAFPICGNGDSTINGGTEAQIQLRIGAAYTVAFFSVYLSTNTRTDTTIYGTRKNGANGNQSVSVGTLATGFFEDTTNSDSLVIGDLLNCRQTFGAGTGNAGFSASSVELTGPDAHHWADQWLLTTPAYGASTTNYIHPVGLFQLSSTTEADVQFKSRTPLFLSYAALYVGTNGTAGISTVTLRKNAAPATLSMSIGAGATGLFTDTANTERVTATDLVNWQLVVAAGGTLAPTTLSLLATANTQVTTPITGFGRRMQSVIYSQG